MATFLQQVRANEIDNGVYIPIDVREYKQYIKNHIKNAINIEFEYIMRIDSVYEWKKLMLENEITNNREIVLYCERGGRSIYAVHHLYNLGIKCYSLSGGFEAYERYINMERMTF